MTMNKQILIWVAFILCFASCSNGTRSSEQSETSQTAYNTETIEEIPSYEGTVAPTDGVPDDISDGQYAYEDDNSYSDNYSGNTGMYDDNEDDEPVRDANYYYQKGYSDGRHHADFDRMMIYYDDCEAIKSSYWSKCDLGDFPDADRTNKEHYLIYKQGFLDGWNSVQGALD